MCHTRFAGAVVALVLMAVASGHFTGAEEPDGKDAVRAFMRGKLDSSKDVLEGLVTEDYEMLANAADRMRVMSKKAEWNSIKTEKYVQFSQEFQRATEQLATAGREKKLDSAALAWTQVTLTCVNCHQYARGVRMADAGNPSLVPNALAAIAAGEK